MTKHTKHVLKRLALVAPLAALSLGANPALAQNPQPAVEARQASISFVNRGGIRDWEADGRDTLYIQDRSRQWYKATLMSPSFELPFAWAIGFDTGPIDRLDNFSTVIVDGQRYPIDSLVKVDGPPAKRS